MEFVTLKEISEVLGKKIDLIQNQISQLSTTNSQQKLGVQQQSPRQQSSVHQI
jgi:hypothetical protein